MNVTRMAIVAAVAAAVLCAGLSSEVWAGGRAGSMTIGPNGEKVYVPDEGNRVRSEYDYIDLGLTPAQEESLAQELHARGKLRWDAERTPEEENAFKYLTRPVPICEEAAPGGLVWNLMISLKEGTTEGEMAALLADLGNPPIVREERREDGSPDYVYLRLPRSDFSNDHKPDDLKEILRKEAIQVPGEYDSLLMLHHNSTYIDPRHPCIAYTAADPYLSCRLHVRKRMLTVSYRGSVTDEDIQALERKHGLVELGGCGASRVTHGTFFIVPDVLLGSVDNALWMDPLVAGTGTVNIIDWRGTFPRDLPTDLDWTAQWDFHQNRAIVGTNYGTGADSRDFDVDGPEGWWLYNHSGASGTPVIAVIDGGFRVDHVDLINKWRTSPTGEYGWNFMEPPAGGSAINSTTITSGDPALIWHGTAVAGLAAGETYNGLCLAGAHWSAEIMPIVCDGNVARLLAAIQYAHTEGADIVNMSFGDFAFDAVTRDLIIQMHNEGVLFFTAAGNGNEDEARDNWPSDYAHVVMVGGTAPDNRRFYQDAGCGSAWGTGVSVSAPAVHLTTLGDASDHALSYDVWGCSFACPKVAGLAGLLWAKYGPVNTGTDADRIVQILKCGVSDIDGDVTNPTGSSSDPQEGEDDLGLGRPSMFKTMTGPRVKKVALSQGVDRILTDGDLDGDGILNVTDWDLDGDGFSNLNDENDDGDGEMDGAAGGADTDDDGDLLTNGSEDENGSRWNAPGEGTLVLALTFNESMGLEEGSTILVSPQDPDVRLVLTDGSELTFPGNAGGDTDWPFEHELNLGNVGSNL